ncbi:MAG: hypothetical protein ACP5NP_12150 [Acetobacteraceae bacterium]
MTDAARLFDILQRLSGAGPMRPETVGARIGVVLARDPAASDAVKDVFASAAVGGNLVEAARLSCPASTLAGTSSSLVLTLAPAVRIGKADVREAYGAESSTIIPTPREPPGSPMGLWYRRDWADVLFSFSTTEDRLIGVIIDEREP